jgi:hypothetical protein
MWKAFQGPNGWYVAWEFQDGYHWQRSGEMTQADAEAHADDLNEAEEP